MKTFCSSSSTLNGSRTSTGHVHPHPHSHVHPLHGLHRQPDVNWTRPPTLTLTSPPSSQSAPAHVLYMYAYHRLRDHNEFQLFSWMLPYLWQIKYDDDDDGSRGWTWPLPHCIRPHKHGNLRPQLGLHVGTADHLVNTYELCALILACIGIATAIWRMDLQQVGIGSYCGV